MAESSGLSFHFFADWQQCRRAFYWRRIARLEGPRRLGLSIGTALHEAVAAFRKGKDYKDALIAAFDEAAFFDETDRRKAFLKASSWMLSWTSRYGLKELGRKIVEQELTIDVAFGTLSGTPDLIEITPDGIEIEDLKTSSYKNEADISESETLSDQYAHYAFLVRTNHELNPLGQNPRIRINAAYVKPDLPQAFVSDSFYVSVESQEAYIEGLAGLYGEIVETLEAFADGTKLERCFPRNCTYCQLFGCAYAPICRATAEHDIRDRNRIHSVPAGFGLRAEDLRVTHIVPVLGGPLWQEESM